MKKSFPIKNTDTVDIKATPGEFVVNRPAAQLFKPYLEAINEYGKAMMQMGGDVPDKKRTAALPQQLFMQEGGRVVDRGDVFRRRIAPATTPDRMRLSALSPQVLNALQTHFSNLSGHLSNLSQIFKPRAGQSGPDILQTSWRPAAGSTYVPGQYYAPPGVRILPQTGGRFRDPFARRDPFGGGPPEFLFRDDLFLPEGPTLIGVPGEGPRKL